MSSRVSGYKDVLQAAKAILLDFLIESDELDFKYAWRNLLFE